MKNRVDRLADVAFADELISLAPEPVDCKKLTEQVFGKLELSVPVQNITELPTVKAKRPRAQVFLIAAVIVVLSTMGVFAANGILKLSENKISYFDAGESPAATTSADSAANTASNETSHEVTAPIFHQGLDVAIEKLNTPVGKSISYGGITITLDTVAMDDNFLNLFFTAEYDKPVDFQAIYPDNYPGTLSQDGSYPEYSTLSAFLPSFWIGIDTMPNPEGEALWEESADAYFVDDKTIRISARYNLPEIYPDEVTIYAKAYSAINADGEQLLGQTDMTIDANPFTYQVAIDKSAGNSHRRSIKPGVYTFGDETLTLNKLMISPFGALMTYQQEVTDHGELWPDVQGLSVNQIYMVDDKGNVIDLCRNPTRGFSYEEIQTIELLNLDPDAKSLTIMPFKENPGGEDISKRYAVEGIVGHKIEVSPYGGYIVRGYSVSNGTVEIELEPYGRSSVDGSRSEFILDDDEIEITLAGSRSGLIRQQYNRDTNRYIYAVDYYAATDEELNQIQYFTVGYNDYYIPDWDAAITLPIEAINN